MNTTMDREIPSSERLRDQTRRLRKPILWLLGFAALVIWGFGLLRPGLPAERFRTAIVERGALEAVIVAGGTVQPAADRVITSPVAARLLRVLERPGSRVEPGDAILELDLSASRLTLGQLEGRIERQISRREELRLELDNDRIELDNRLQIKALEREEADFELEQQRRLHEEGLLSEAGLRQIQTRVRRLIIELEGLRANRLNADQASKTKLESVDSELRSLEGERAQLNRELERASTRAEQAGVITWVLDDEGASVVPGDELARLADLGRFRVEASASDVHASRLSPGLAVRIPLDRGRSPAGSRHETDPRQGSNTGQGSNTERRELSGHIERILPSVDEGSVRFWVELDDADKASDALRPNLRVDVLVVLEHKNDVLTVPKGPFVNGPGAHEVFVLTGDRSQAIRRTVEFGLSGYDRWQVVSGLQAGDEVVISDVSDLRTLTQWKVR